VITSGVLEDSEGQNLREWKNCSENAVVFERVENSVTRKSDIKSLLQQLTGGQLTNPGPNHYRCNLDVKKNLKQKKRVNLV